MDKLKDENENLKKELADLKSEKSKDKDEAEKAAGAKDAEIAKLKAAVDNAPDIDKLVSERQTLLDTAKKHLPSDFTFTGKDSAAIKRAVAATRVGDDALKDRSDEYVDGIFEAISKDTSGSFADDTFVPSGEHQTTNARDNGYGERIKSLESAWKN